MDTTITSLRQEIESRCRDFDATLSRGEPRAGPVVGGEQIAQFWGGIMAAGGTALRLETTEVESCGETLIEVGRYTLSSTAGQVVDQGKHIVIWKQEDGAWKVQRDIWNTSLLPQQ